MQTADKATYNITNDRLKVWFPERLSAGDYDAMKRAGFQFWHGSKCFTAIWTPEREDLITRAGVTIEADDTPDDVESRVQRFEKYAGRAQDHAAGGESRLETANTERRKENALAAIEKGLTEAEHWQRRIAGAISNAQYKERPDVIARRIRNLEADERRHINDFTVYEPQPDVGQEPGQVWVGKGRGAYWKSRADLPAIEARAKRWIEHIKRRIAYEMACLEAAGGAFDVLRPKRKVAVQPKGKAKASDGKFFEVGGAMGFRRGYGSGPLEWRLVLKVNRTTLETVAIYPCRNSFSELTTPYEPGSKPHYSVSKTEAYGTVTAKTAAEVQTDLPALYSHWVNIQRILKEKAERKAKAEQGAA